MEPVSTQAVILRSLPVGESDTLLDLFTRETGRLTCLVKGGNRSRKRFGGLLLSAHLLQVEVVPPRSGDLFRLQAAFLHESFLGLRLDWRRWLMAGPVLELLLRAFAPHAPHPSSLDLALLTLGRLAKAEDPSEMGSALLIFLTRLLSQLGYGLSLTACPLCGGSLTEVCRLSLAGGLVCARCRPESQARQTPPGLVKGLLAAQTLEPPALARLRFPPALLCQGLDFVAEFWRRVLGHDLPSLDLAGQAMTAIKALPPARAMSSL
jgi:DNA repair protein RecO (recombination protein O)